MTPNNIIVKCAKNTLWFISGLFTSPIIPIIFITVALSLPKKTGEEKQKRKDQQAILMFLGVASLIIQITRFTYERIHNNSNTKFNYLKNTQELFEDNLFPPEFPWLTLLFLATGFTIPSGTGQDTERITLIILGFVSLLIWLWIEYYTGRGKEGWKVSKDIFLRLLILSIGLSPLILIIVGFSLPRKNGKEQKKRDEQKLILIITGFSLLLIGIIIFSFGLRHVLKSMLATSTVAQGV